MVKYLLTYLLILFSAASGYSQEIKALASTDTTDYLIGDYINFTIDLKYDKNIQILGLSAADSLHNVELIKTEKPVTKETEDKIERTYIYVLSVYDSTDVTIPPIPVFYKISETKIDGNNPNSNDSLSMDSETKVIYTNPVSFTVRTVKVSQSEDIKDVKAPLTIALDWKIILMWVLIVLIVAVIVIYFVRKYLKKKRIAEGIEERIVIPAHVKAFNALKELEEKKLWQKGKIKEYHSELTEIIRSYFEERFNLPALELTTSEAIEQLKNKKDAESIIATTIEFLNNADLVKFAKYIPMNTINEEMMKQAYEIVQRTIPKTEEQEFTEAADV